MHAAASINARPSASAIAANWQDSAHTPQPMHSSAVLHADVAGRGQHGHAVALGLHRAAAARAAVADGVEAAEHRVLEERVVDVAALVLGASGSPTASSELIQRDRSGWCSRTKLANGSPTIRQTSSGRHGFGRAARQGHVQGDDVVGVLQHDVARQRVGDDLLQVAQVDVAVRP